MRMQGTKAEKAREVTEAREFLLTTLPPGSTVYSVLRHVSASGMSRRIDFYTIADNRPVYLSGYIGRILNMRRHKDGGLIVSGCGMDMGFHIVHSLSYALYRDVADIGGARSGYNLNHEWI